MVDTPEQILKTLQGFSERSKMRIEKRKRIRKQIEDFCADKDRQIAENKKTKKDTE